MNNEIRFGISELANAAGVTVRTVRYYITEGLLPPPVTAGAKSYYTDEHRDRLIVIGRLKDGYLPLREIRRQLAAMDVASIHDMAESTVLSEERIDPEDNHSGLPPRAFHQSMELNDTLGFIAGQEDIRSSSSENIHRPRDSATDYIRRVLHRVPEPKLSVGTPLPLPSPVLSPSAIGEEPPSHYGSPPDPSIWRRIVISDGAEMLIRDDIYHRRRDKVNWLVEWATKVLN